MTRYLWAIEAKLKKRRQHWILLPNIIMVDRRSAAFEMRELRKDPSPYTAYRMVKYARIYEVPETEDHP